MNGRTLSVAGAVAVAALTPAAIAGATTTLERTVAVDKSNPFKILERGPGERHQVLQAGLGGAKRNRAERRVSLSYFSQLTDPQLADEMSPARIEVFDPAGGDFTAAWRPQEAMGTQVLDQIVRGVNANTRSPVAQGNGKAAKLGFALTTGDQPDNMQMNEVEWFRGVLEGEQIDPFSGQALSASNPCAAATPEQAAALDAAVAARQYTGVQDYDDYPNQVDERYQGFWDPDTAPPGGGPYAAFPQYPGLMERAQEPFAAAGLRVPWYAARGNHDGLIQGNVPANIALFVGLATGCSKIMPGPNFDPATISGSSGSNVIDQIANDPALLASLFADSRLVPPDPDRRFVSPVEYKQLLAGADKGHGFGFVSDEQEQASAGAASYYAFTRNGIRFISLDTVAEGGGANGNLDNPQYEWLQDELDKSSAVEYGANGKLVRDGDPNRLIVVYGHHTLETMDNTTPDEEAGPCTTPPLPGCDIDPRDSQPVHLGTTGQESVKSLLFRYPNVIAAVTGHTHHNAIKAYVKRNPNRGFWEINTASHVDFPQQSRLLEIMDNGDGTLSIFGTIVDQAAPAKAAAAGTAATGLTDRQLASISRQLAANDPQRVSVTINGGTGRKRDRNAEMIIRDPRQLAD